MSSEHIKCTMPYRQIHFNSKGTFGPCCQYLHRNDLFDISSVNEYLQSDQLANIKTRLNNGERIENCKMCWNQEESGISSMRQRTITLDTDKITEVFITFGNQCNTACRICNANRSSLIGSYDKKYVDKTDDPDLKKLLTVGSTDWVNGKVWYNNIESTVLELLDDLKVIQISGGEPFINVYFDKFIDALLASGKSLPHIKITTNGSFTKEQIERLSAFKKVSIFFSVDSLTKESYEYLRWPLKYNDLLKKIDILKGVDFSNLVVNFQAVMHNLNLSHIANDAKWFSRELAGLHNFFLTFTVLNYVDWYSIQNSPKHVREEEVVKLENMNWDNRIQPAKEKIIDYINTSKGFVNLKMLEHHIKYTDSYRNVDTWKFLGWHVSDLTESENQ